MPEQPPRTAEAGHVGPVAASHVAYELLSAMALTPPAL